MRTTVRLYAADLHYPKDLELHTAASGPVPSLSARYLAIERSDGFSGIGEVRANITYLSHLPESEVDPAIIGLCGSLPWNAAPEEIRDAVHKRRADTPYVATAAVENALVEGMARGCGMPVAEWLGGEWRDGVATNQCLFWNPDETFDRLAQRFLAAFVKTVAWFYDVGNRAEAVSVMAEVSKLKVDDVEKAYDFLAGKKLFEPSGQVSRAKLARVVDALRELGDVPADFPVERLFLPGVTRVVE